MIVMVNADKSVSLVQADDFKRFHCEIQIPNATLEQAQAALKGIAELESRELAWVDVDALLALKRDSTAPQWEPSVQTMIEKARPHGWVRDEPLAIKSHIVWQA
jgi:hypothetical protein